MKRRAGGRQLMAAKLGRFSLLALSLVLAASAARAQTIAGVTVPGTAEVNGKILVLNGAGLRRKLFVKVYVGALYLPSRQTTAAAALGSDSPRQMQMHFVYAVGKGSLIEAWQTGLRDNTPNASPEVTRAFQTLCSWMEDMQKGSTLVLTYVPGTGTTVDVSGTRKGTLPGGKAVADAILATWIGPNPGPGEEFKAAVLGG
jgi:hypothetical protein